MTGQPEAVTEAELDWALRHHGSGLTAQALIREIRENREPEYEPGSLYRDPSGRVYLRAASWWLWLDPIGSGKPAQDDCVETPLRRLVTEGDPLADSERDLIRADLGKLLDLLGLGDFARPASSHEVFLMCLEAARKMAGDTGGTCPGGC